MESPRPATLRVTGIGSMPGTDSAEATRIVAGELDVPHMVELPARGPGGDMLGRTLSLVAAATGEFAAETTPSGWRLTGGRMGGDPGRQMRRGASWLAEDIDRMEHALAGSTGQVKLQLVGPWTLAAGLEAVRGTRLLADRSACLDLTEALAEALTGHAAEIARRVPGAEVVVQVDEPGLPQVLAGRVRTPSGRGAVRIPSGSELSAGLGRVAHAARAAGAGEVVAHCCARQVPFELLHRSGFTAISVDAEAVGQGADESLGAWWDRGGTVVLGIAPATAGPALDGPGMGGVPDAYARRVSALWDRIGFGVADLGGRTWLSPTCGLAGATPDWARSVGAVLRRAAAMLESAQ